MSPIDSLRDWLLAIPELAEFEPVLGIWRESEEDAGKRMFALMAQGGGNPGPDNRFQRVRVILLGAQGESRIAGNPTTLRAAADAAIAKTLTEWKACEIAQVKALSDIIGPGLTTEDRPWYEINFELTF